MAVSKKKKDNQLKLLEESEGKEIQDRIKRMLSKTGDKLYKNYDHFAKVIDDSSGNAGISVSASVRKAIINALSERDETADIVRNNKGEPEPDTELRDYENVPLDEDIYEYFEREVKPHVPDAWINTSLRDEKDGKIGKVGYEINFNKYFYKYQPPRSLDEIDADIQKTQNEILELLRQTVRK